MARPWICNILKILAWLFMKPFWSFDKSTLDTCLSQNLKCFFERKMPIIHVFQVWEKIACKMYIMSLLNTQKFECASEMVGLYSIFRNLHVSQWFSIFFKALKAFYRIHLHLIKTWKKWNCLNCFKLVFYEGTISYQADVWSKILVIVVFILMFG